MYEAQKDRISESWAEFSDDVRQTDSAIFVDGVRIPWVDAMNAVDCGGQKKREECLDRWRLVARVERHVDLTVKRVTNAWYAEAIDVEQGIIDRYFPACEEGDLLVSFIGYSPGEIGWTENWKDFTVE